MAYSFLLTYRVHWANQSPACPSSNTGPGIQQTEAASFRFYLCFLMWFFLLRWAVPFQGTWTWRRLAYSEEPLRLSRGRKVASCMAR